MSTAPATPPPPAKPQVKRSSGGKGMMIVSALLALLVALCAYLFKDWNSARTAVDEQTAILSETQTRNAQLADADLVLQNKRFAFCNRTKENVELTWVAAVYHDGTALKVFDSGRCNAWEPIFVGSGQSKNLRLQTTESGCLWNGDVMYYAMVIDGRTEEGDLAYRYRVSGRYHGFDRDCFNLE